MAAVRRRIICGRRRNCLILYCSPLPSPQSMVLSLQPIIMIICMTIMSAPRAAVLPLAVPSFAFTPHFPRRKFCILSTAWSKRSNNLLTMPARQKSIHTGAAASSRQENSPQTKSSTNITTTRPTTTRQQSANTGGLRRLPIVLRSTELISRAKKTAWHVKPDLNLKNAKHRARKHGAEKLDALTKALCLPLRDAVDGYRRVLRRLHPFEKVVADLTVSARARKDGLTLSDILNEIHEARKELLLAGKDWIAVTKNAETAKDASNAIKKGEEQMCQTFTNIAAKPIDGLIELQRSLRTIPAVQLDSPAVVLVGAPNVGKSSIVRAISSASPEVNNYPFTTRGMTLGHVEIFWNNDGEAIKYDNDAMLGRQKSISTQSPFPASGSYAFSQLCQVMDSPGLLVRDDSERNEMESLTLAAMRHLPTAVMYVMDLSGEAGDKCSSVNDQLSLRREIRGRFPRRPWIDVVSKVDMGIVDGAAEELDSILQGEASTAAKDEKGRKVIHLSVQTGHGVHELREAVMQMLAEVKVVLDAMAAVDNDR